MKIKNTIKKIIHLTRIDQISFYKKIIKKRHLKSFELFKKEQKILLDKYNNEILNFINTVCQENGYHVWIEYGTLLGAVRNNRIIPHDCDMDFGIYAHEYDENFERLLIDYGFTKIHHFILYNKKNRTKEISEVTYTYNGLHIDFFFSFKDKDNRISYVFHDNNENYSYKKNERSVKRLITKVVEPFEQHSLEGISCLSPYNSRLYLSQVYGKDFLVPDPNWTAQRNDTIVEFLPEEDYIGYYINDCL